MPSYGAWKNGDQPHTGYNKTLGGGRRSSEYTYVEERNDDTIKIKQEPIWRTTPQMEKTMAQRVGILALRK